MRPKEFATEELRPVTELACEDGARRFVTEFAAGDGVDFITARLPKGSAVTVIAASEDEARDYRKRLRRAGIVSRFLLADDKEAEPIEIPEDVRMLVAVGGEYEVDCAKRIGTQSNLPTFAAICSPAAATALDRFAWRESGGLPLCKPCAPPVGVAVVRDDMTASGNDLPAALGGVCSVATALFDCEAYARATGKTVCAEIREAAYDILFGTLDACAKYGRDSKELPVRLADAAVKLSLLSQTQEGGFVRGAADDCARTARLLFRHEGRAELTRGEFAFLFGAVLCKLYGAFVSQGSPFVPPPDNNLRAERLCEYLGLDEVTATRAAVRKVRQVGLAAYRVHEYRDELADAAAESARVFAEAERRFRRLYADDGYGLRGKLDPSDVKTVVALAPDLFPPQGTALTLMREFGLLDRYL